ncbi:B12-binding domain-containing radical SAM protein, partial [Mycobacterium ostraviense]
QIALGNVIATLNYERILDEYDCFDFVVVGDGEVAFTELALAVVNGAGVDNIAGLARRDGRGGVLCSPSGLVDLDELAWPARAELPTVLGDGFAASVFTSRGCPYRCTFCGTGAVSAMLGRTSYRVKSVEAVVEEIDYLVSDFGIGFVSITDDLFVSKHPGSQQRAVEFASTMRSRGIDVDFMIDIRLDSVVDLEVFRHLYRAGFAAGVCRVGDRFL